MRWKPHVRFGGRAGETDSQKRKHGAPVRPYWATQALDEVRRQVWNEFRVLARQETARPRGRPPANGPARPYTDGAKGLKGARYSLWKNPENLSDKQQQKLDWITTTSPRLGICQVK
jgi:transposase